MARTLEATTPDLGAIKQRQQQTWASGDFHQVAPPRSCSSPSSCATPPTCTPAGACSTSPRAAATPRSRRPGSAARPSASTTFRPCSSAAASARPPRASPSSCSRATPRRCRSPTRSFDAVTSVFGTMFAPDHEKTAAELLRVCRPGGTIALASWTPDGFIGELFRTIARARAAARRACARRCSGAPRRTCASCSATASPRSR